MKNLANSSLEKTFIPKVHKDLNKSDPCKIKVQSNKKYELEMSRCILGEGT